MVVDITEGDSQPTPPSPSSSYVSALGSEYGADADDGVDNEPLKIPTASLDPEALDSALDALDDLLPRIKNAYRLLELFSEQGTGGLVDKVIIPQDSLRNLINVLSPGAFEEMTKINFASLDATLLKPLGVYGSKSELVRLLLEINAIDDETGNQLLKPQYEDGTLTVPHLRTGIYMILCDSQPLGSDQNRPIQSGYLLYWPEDKTWDDNAPSDVRRNRVTFMHYLTRLSDQQTALLSKEHAESIIWKDRDNNESDQEAEDSEQEDQDDRAFRFMVQKTVEQEESVTVHDGFNISIPNPPSAQRQNATELKLANSHSVIPVQIVDGDTRQGILTSTFVAARPVRSQHRDRMSSLRLAAFMEKSSIFLAEDLDGASVDFLFEVGLKQRFPEYCDEYEATRKDFGNLSNQKYEDDCLRAEASLKQDKQRLVRHIKNQLLQTLETMYPIFASEAKNGLESADPPGHPGAIVHGLSDHLSQHQIRSAGLDLISAPRFQPLKRRFIVTMEICSHNSAEIWGRLDRSMDDPTEWSEIVHEIYHDQQQSKGWAFGFGTTLSFVRAAAGAAMSPFRHFETLPKKYTDSRTDRDVSDEHEIPHIREAMVRAGHMRDGDFFRTVVTSQIAADFAHSATMLRRLALEWLLSRIAEVAVELAETTSRDQVNRWKRERATARDRDQFDHSLSKLGELKIRINEASATDSASSHQTYIHRVTRDRGYPGREGYGVDHTLVRNEPNSIEYALYLIGLSSTDAQQISRDSEFLPQPTVRRPIRLSCAETSKLRHIQLLERSKCIVFVENASIGKLLVYLDDETHLSSAILSKPDNCKKALYLDKIGVDYLISVNEPRKLIALLSVVYRRLHVFVIDETYTIIHQYIGSIDLGTQLMSDPGTTPAYSNMCFIPGLDELIIVEASGYARIFSLAIQQFKPVNITLEVLPELVLCSLDGSCIFFVSNPTSDQRTVTAYHYASFENAPSGQVLQLPDAFRGQLVHITSLISPGNAYLTSVDYSRKRLCSVRLHIMSSASEWNLKQACGRGEHLTQVNPVHNVLVDCHTEVWDKFPVVSTIKRSDPSEVRVPRSIHFVSECRIPTMRLQAHFLRMVDMFQQKTQKPTENRLRGIHVSAVHGVSFVQHHFVDQITSYLAGKWIIELICLIPIHIAITSSNRFVPLKDGIVSIDFEHQLLGAAVMDVADRLSVGWYESLLHTYFASKPVKVISSMGKQSVGKSYALNHFADTSFAGSAMRCTEGVWLSVTPTDKEVIISLDFEGIHSIERSSQEDMLLVLFNVALSNLVLFRNDFAISRDVAELFTSFQSSVSQFEPDDNPDLFQSTLAIIIKDVVDSDVQDVVREFELKFQNLVRKEKGENFISKLHRDRLDIVAWPVIQSQKFYSQLNRFKRRLDKQPSSHGTAAVFLQRLKVLMAKLKASDWARFDQTLASHRATILRNLLPSVLQFGVSELGNDDSFLKDMDTNEPISDPDGDSHFYIESETNDADARDSLLAIMQARWISANSDQRQAIPDSEWLTAMASSLLDQANRRIDFVDRWITTNLRRFRLENADIQLLHSQFERLSHELISGVDVCGTRCRDCNLKCILSREHSASVSHNCRTNHRCRFECSAGGVCLSESNACGMMAGHDGIHVCEVKNHLCGEPCYLDGKVGCQHACVKPYDHKGEDPEHLCAARVHSCGFPCRLNSFMERGLPLCSKPCLVDCRDAHNIHMCGTTMTCPAKCTLCNRLCAEKDHFHALETNAIHLCGQEHECQEMCESRGICHIASAPRAVEITFVGKNVTFPYTKYTQEAHKRRCAMRIPSDRLQHDGPHVHSTAKEVFHFCEKRCPHCQYFCTLKIGHLEAHDTTHGNMDQTAWTFEGDDAIIREVAGRNFSTGDVGDPMLCNMVCAELDRHVHVDFCRSPPEDECTDDTVEHIRAEMSPEPSRPKDWTTHSTYWSRTGFRDPYSQTHRDDFATCDAMCNGEEHKASESSRAQPSYCTLPMFHRGTRSPHEERAPSLSGWTSSEGHHFTCKSPAQNVAYHVIFVLDHSGSMSEGDRGPLAGHAASSQIRSYHRNRYGAVLSALYNFWTARQASASRGPRRDSYSVILFDHSPINVIMDDFTRSPDELLAPLLRVSTDGGTDFQMALEQAQDVMESCWSNERVPAMIFLSDGESYLPDDTMHILCNRAKDLGHPLVFHAVSFAAGYSTGVLENMASIAQSAYPSSSASGDVPCAYHDAMDSVQLSQTFLGIAESMRRTRGALLRK